MINIRKLSSLIFLSLLCIFVLLLSSCNIGGDVVAGTHKEKDHVMDTSGYQQYLGEWTQVSDPTCDREGQKQRTCSVCGYVETQSILKLPHTFAESWTSDANYHWHASMCEHTSEMGDRKPHSFGEWTQIQTPTCDQAGEQTRVCSVCQYQDTQVVEKLAHTFGNEWQNDQDYHWHVATCQHSTEVDNKALHDFDTNNLCSTCGYQEPVGSSGLVYEISDDKTYYLVVGYTTLGRDVTIPRYHQGLPVKEIAPNAFDGSSIDSIVIANTVLSIGESAFSSCHFLDTITIPASVTSFGTYCFVDSEALVNVNYLGTIDQWASISFGNSNANPLSVAKSLFIDNAQVTSVNLTTATNVSNYAFYNCQDITSVVLGDSVEGVGRYAFYNCNNLQSVIIFSSVLSVGENALYNANSLQSVHYVGTIDQWARTSFGDYGNPLLFATKWYVNDELVEGKINLTTVTEIGHNAFRGSSITSVVMSNSVTSIGKYAFADCLQLTSITLSNSLTALEDNTFENCSSLQSIVIPNGVETIGDWTFSGCSSLKSVTLPSKLTSLGRYAFRDCELLEGIEIPSTVNVLSSGVFDGCKSLESVVIPYGITELYQTFKDCHNLKSVVIPNSVTNVGEETFYNCKSLQSVSISSNVTQIGKYAFAGCESLATVVIPNSVTELGYGAFHGCKGLTSVSLSNGIKILNGSVFGNCTSLTEITIPQNVTHLMSSVFYNCSQLEKVNVESGKTCIDSNVFSGCAQLKTINYGGTTEDWLDNTVYKSWNNTGDYVVVCTNGSVDKSGVVTSN